MNNTLKLQSTLDKALDLTKNLVSPEEFKELENKSEEFSRELVDSQYIKVPLVGVFSAGKSSLLNVFTRKPGMLPVDTMPETAVAYELYYAANECVELYRDGQKIDTKPLADIKLLNTKPGDIAKVYCTSEPIKDLQSKGIILVDMPGIGSGIERHDAAIFNYIQKGTAFVLLVDAEQGSLRGSTLSFMQELSKYDMHPAIIVSKIDKKPVQEVQNILEYIRYQMTKLGDKTPYISTVCAVDNNLTGFSNYISALDAEQLVAEKMGKKLSLIINSIIDHLKMRVEVRAKDIEDADKKLQEIEEEIANVKAELPQDNGTADSPEKSTQDVIDNVIKALEAKSYDIAQMIANREDEESIKSVFVSTIRAEIIASLKEETEQYSKALGSAVEDSVKGLGTIEINTDFLDNFSDIMDKVRDFVSGFLSAGGIWGKIFAILIPVVEGVINWLIGKSKADRIEEVRQKVIIQFDDVAKKLYPAVLKLTKENQKRIQEKIQAELVAKMEQVKGALREKIADANKSKAEVENDLAAINKAISELTNLSKTI